MIKVFVNRVYVKVVKGQRVILPSKVADFTLRPEEVPVVIAQSTS